MEKCGIAKTAVILAAGLGSRLKGHCGEKPKGFLEIDGTPIIVRSIKILQEAGLREVIIGTGHKSSFYEEMAAGSGGFIKCVKNENYASTGSMATLYGLRHVIDDDFILLESDLIYYKKGINFLLEDVRKNLILASDRTGSGDEVFIETGDGGSLAGMSKSPLKLKKIDAELVGISKVSPDAYKAMCDFYESTRAENPKLDYESAFVAAAKRADIYVKRIDGYPWCEIDDENHLQRALNEVYPRIIESEKYGN